MADDEDSYETGFGKPPRHTQFRKGQSGNPKGRPKGSKNLAYLFLKITEEKVTVNGPGGPRRLSKLQAGITQLVNRAAGGDVKAIREVIQWRKEFGDLEPLHHLPLINVHFVTGKNGRPIEEDEDKTDKFLEP